MKLETAVKKVAEFLASNPGSTKEAIGKATKVKGLELTNALKRLRKEERLIEEYPDGEEPKFSIKAEEEQRPEEETPVDETEIPVEDEQLPSKKGRDNKKFSFNGNLYGKGPLVREVIREYVAGHKTTTYKQLKAIFPDELLKRFGIFQDEETARSLSGARDRYFFKDEHAIKLKDKTIYVCNQFTSENIQPFLKVARGLGFKIK